MLDLRRQILSALRQSIEGDEPIATLRERLSPLLARLLEPERTRRGLTDVERDLLETLHDRLAIARDRVSFALKENTVDHAMPALQDVRSIYQGAAFVEALMLEPIGPGTVRSGPPA